jgi:hypothetical protein
MDSLGTPPDVPSLEHILDITARNVEDRLRRETQANVERNYYEDYKVSILTASLLPGLVAMIEKTAAEGGTGFLVQTKAEADVTVSDGRAVARAVKDALRAFNPEAHFVSYDEPPHFYGWHVKLDWKTHLEKRLYG